MPWRFPRASPVSFRLKPGPTAQVLRPATGTREGRNAKDSNKEVLDPILVEFQAKGSAATSGPKPSKTDQQIIALGHIGVTQGQWHQWWQ